MSVSTFDAKFRPGDHVTVKDGRTGRIAEKQPWVWLDRIIYQVDFADGSFFNYFEDALTAETSPRAKRIATLRKELAALEKAEALDAETKVPTTLPIGSSIFFPPTSLVTKVDEDKWHWFYVGGTEMQHHSNSADKAVSSEIRESIENKKKYEVFPADQD